MFIIMDNPKFDVGDLIIVNDSRRDKKRLFKIRDRRYSTLATRTDPCWHYSGDLYDIELRFPLEESSIRYATTLSGCAEDRLEKRVI